MYASDYLRVKFQSDQQLAIYGHQGFRAGIRASKGIAEDIYSGIQRASWYSSCLIPKYHDVCRELMTENDRAVLSVLSIYKHKDVIARMLYLYFKLIFEDARKGNPEGEVHSVDRKVTGVVAGIATARATRSAAALAISKSLAESQLLSQAVAERLSRRMPTVVAVFQIMGIEQHCAMAARRLKALHPKYYWLLYNEQLEMLYYFIEPVLSKVMEKAGLNAGADYAELLQILKEEFNV